MSADLLEIYEREHHILTVMVQRGQARLAELERDIADLKAKPKLVLHEGGGR